MATLAVRCEKPALSTDGLEGSLVLFHMTSDQFCELPLSPTVKLELLDGEVIMSPRPLRDHQHFLTGLLVVLTLWTRAKKLGRVLPDMLVKLSGSWTPAPDLVFVATRHLKRVKKKRMEGPMNLAVEILLESSQKLDRETKFTAYAQHGIRWYWIVELENRVLEVHQLTGRNYGNLIEAPFDAPFEPRLLPGLMNDLTSLEW